MSTFAVRRSSPTLLLFLTATLACAHSGRDRSDDVLAANHERVAAMVAADSRRLGDALHESLSYTHSDGRVDSKPAMIDSLATGRVDYRSIHLDEPSVRVRDRTAVVTGRAHMEISAGEGRLDLNGAYTAVYWWEDGRWQLAAYHSSRVTPP